MSNAVALDPAAALRLPEILDLKAAAPLLGDLLALRGRDLTIDASQVRRMGGQCLQVILSAMDTWRADQVALSVADPSPEFVEYLELFGIQKEVLA